MLKDSEGVSRYPIILTVSSTLRHEHSWHLWLFFKEEKNRIVVILARDVKNLKIHGCV
jgi:hypothetical protein